MVSGKSFLVSVSGGPDSLALTALTKSYKLENNNVNFIYVLILIILSGGPSQLNICVRTRQVLIYTATFSVASAGAVSEYFALYSASAEFINEFQSALLKPVNLVIIPSDIILKDPHNLCVPSSEIL